MNTLLIILIVVMDILGAMMYVSVLESEHPKKVERMSNLALCASAISWPLILATSMFVVTWNELKKI